jgi:hypothetical protein
MKTKRILNRILSFILITSCLYLNSCEPIYCAYCWGSKFAHYFQSRRIEFCADTENELQEMINYAENEMGCYCEVQERDE